MTLELSRATDGSKEKKPRISSKACSLVPSSDCYIAAITAFA